jgi:hypothetical protein
MDAAKDGAAANVAAKDGAAANAATTTDGAAKDSAAATTTDGAATKDGAGAHAAATDSYKTHHAAPHWRTMPAPHWRTTRAPQNARQAGRRPDEKEKYKESFLLVPALILAAHLCSCVNPLVLCLSTRALSSAALNPSTYTERFC